MRSSARARACVRLRECVINSNFMLQQMICTFARTTGWSRSRTTYHVLMTAIVNLVYAEHRGAVKNGHKMLSLFLM